MAGLTIFQEGAAAVFSVLKHVVSIFVHQITGYYTVFMVVPCKTVGDRGKPCVFPFEYSGRTYDKCTSRDSDNGQPWCATEVDATGYVVDNAWGDCLDGCPGTSELLGCSVYSISFMYYI